jgi:hypothetical protein
MLIPIQPKDNQTLNDNIITLPWCDYMVLTVKMIKDIYKIGSWNK